MAKYLSYITIAISISLCFPVAAQDEMADLRLLLANEAWDDALKMIHDMLSVDRENPRLWYFGGIAHRNLMRPDSTLFYLSNSARLDYENDRTLSALARVYTDMDQYSRATELYQELIKRDSTRIDPYMRLASLYLNDDAPSRALEIYRELNRRDPGNYIHHKNMAICYKRMRDDPSTVRQLLLANEKYSEDLSINISLAELYMITKNYRQGLEIAERGLEVDRRDNQLLFWSGFFNYTLGLYGQAIVRLKNAEDAGNESVRVRQYLGICYFLSKDYENARDYLEKSVTAGLKDFKVFNYLGIIYREMGDYEISEAFFQNSLSLLTPPVKALTETYLHLIETYRLSGNAQMVAETYRSAMIYDGDNPYLHYGLAYTLDMDQKKPDEALEYYVRFSELASGMEADEELLSLLDYSMARIRRIREEMFFGN